MTLPQKISKNKDLSDTAKNLWLPAALWGCVNGKLFGTNLQLFLDTMTTDLDLPEAKILSATQELVGSGLFHELYMKHESFNTARLNVEVRKRNLLHTLQKIDWERHNN